MAIRLESVVKRRPDTTSDLLFLRRPIQIHFPGINDLPISNEIPPILDKVTTLWGESIIFEILPTGEVKNPQYGLTGIDMLTNTSTSFRQQTQEHLDIIHHQTHPELLFDRVGHQLLLPLETN